MATLVSRLVLPLPKEYIVTLGNGSGTGFQASPRHHRPALVADADFLLFLFRNHIDFHADMLILGRLFDYVENLNKLKINVDFGVGV